LLNDQALLLLNQALLLPVQALRPQLEAWVRANGGALTQALLTAAVDTCPRHLLRPLAGALRALLTDEGFREAARQWAVHVLSSPALPGELLCRQGSPSSGDRHNATLNEQLSKPACLAVRERGANKEVAMPNHMHRTAMSRAVPWHGQPPCPLPLMQPGCL
jgi:hypothetical protein